MASIVLPLSCVRHFIEEHPLYQLVNTDVQAIYGVVISILSSEREERVKRPAPKESPQDVPRRGHFVCELCKCTVYVIDTREATMICTECGVCSPLQNTSMREHEKPVVSGSSRAASGKVPDWYNRTMTSDECQKYEIENEMRHWISNPYACVAMDENTYDVTTRRAAMPLRANTTDRVVGAILTHFILQKIDLADIEHKVRADRALPILHYEEKLPQYACNKCGVAVWTAWETRRHPCGWGKKRKR